MTRTETLAGDTQPRPTLDDYESMPGAEKQALLMQKVTALFDDAHNDVLHRVHDTDVAAGIIEDPAERTGFVNLPLAVCVAQPVAEYVGLETSYSLGNHTYRRTLIANTRTGFVHDVTRRSDGQPVYPTQDANQPEPYQDKLAYMLDCLDRLASRSQPVTPQEAALIYGHTV